MLKEIFHVSELIPSVSYWGRGIIAGLTPDGTQAVVAYFIEGRSENSRNRVFIRKGEGIVIEPFDPEKVEDPSLIIYSPIKTLEKKMIVTNGDQTDTIYEAMKLGDTFENSLESRTYEPDRPNYTPRISAMLDFSELPFSYKMNIIRCPNGQGGLPVRENYSYKSHEGVAHFLHTYKGDGDPLPSFDEEPQRLHTYNNIDIFTDELWKYLDADNKVSLFVRYIDLHSLYIQQRVVNKNVKTNKV